MNLLPRSISIGVFVVACLTMSLDSAAQSGSRSAALEEQTTTGSASDRVKNSSEGIAVVELFTSQSCSSCPSADAVLRQINTLAVEKHLPVHVLSFHVDYWNYLQWTDPYSDAAYTKRQRAYARALQSSRVYTPQMIVNGNDEFVGSNKRLANQAIARSLATKSSATIEATSSPSSDQKSIAVQYRLTGVTPGQVVHVAAVQNPEPNAVRGGENSGRTLSHINVVRAFKTQVIDNLSGEVSLQLPDDFNASGAKVIAYVQDLDTLDIIAATSI